MAALGKEKVMGKGQKMHVARGWLAIAWCVGLKHSPSTALLGVSWTQYSQMNGHAPGSGGQIS